ncbi:MliC family protein [Actinobacillus equuli]|uniref:MliC family protein n=1 Tax=Actinobacillus equuli TaxID=718 RepID=UPI00244112E3|nr:MliC family protein [Actinobacillus equuli]WGE85454.1 GlcNAc transferase [Actinobacillus equuli subsp. haemolyticus]
MSVFLQKPCCLAVCTGLLALAGCKPLEAPIEQVQRAQSVIQQAQTEIKPTEKVTVVKNQTSMQFICKNDVVVKVQRPKAKKVNNKAKRKVSSQQAILVTYGHTTHTLSPAVTRDGKKYSNIRWTWRESRNGEASLTDNSNNVLASECKLKP